MMGEVSRGWPDWFELCNKTSRTTRQTLKQMGYSSRRPHWVPFLSVKNRKLRLQWAWTHQNWTIEDWKNVAWSDESRFLRQHLDGGVKIWLKQHESMDPSCLVSTVQAGSSGVIKNNSEFTVLKQPPQSPDLNPTEHILGCGGTGDSHHGCAADKSAATVWCYHVNMDQNLWLMFPAPCWINATKK